MFLMAKDMVGGLALLIPIHETVIKLALPSRNVPARITGLGFRSCCGPIFILFIIQSFYKIQLLNNITIALNKWYNLHNTGFFYRYFLIRCKQYFFALYYTKWRLIHVKAGDIMKRIYSCFFLFFLLSFCSEKSADDNIITAPVEEDYK